MGDDKVLIDFDEEARQDNYMPYAARIWFGEGAEPIVVNYDFSRVLWSNEMTYDEILTDLEEDPRYELPYFDITEEMRIQEG